MSEKFFKIVGGASFFAATISLLLAIGLGFFSGSQYLGSVDESISEPKPTLKKYVQEVSGSNMKRDETYKNGETAELEESDENYQSEIKAIYEKIFLNINSYAERTVQGAVNEQALESYLLSQTMSLEKAEYVNFLKTLLKELVKLNDSNSIVPDGFGGTVYLEWNSFLEWFVRDYMSEYEKEIARVNKEKAVQSQEKTEALTTAVAAAIAFSAFVFFCMILLLVHIERNIRKAINVVLDIEKSAVKMELYTRTVALSKK